MRPARKTISAPTLETTDYCLKDQVLGGCL